MDGHHSGKRFGVTRYWDALGSWFGVVDRQAKPQQNIVQATRSQNVAHARADALNKKEVKR